MLSLFYDDEAMVWGDEPDDREHWRLQWTPADQALVRHERPVAMTDHEEAIFPPVALAVREELTFPAWATRECEALALDERDADAYVDIMERGADRCRLLGYADAVQGGIAELATEATGRPAADVHSWRLLLQISSEDAAQMMWGDVGFLYVSCTSARPRTRCVRIAGRTPGSSWSAPELGQRRDQRRAAAVRLHSHRDIQAATYRDAEAGCSSRPRPREHNQERTDNVRYVKWG